VELLRGRPEHPWTAAELASAVSLSVRSLQEGFRRALDTTPMTYLRRVRLERVHEELVAASPGMLGVTEVAMRWGFVHLGRFATSYREAYGELPSETARAAAGRVFGARGD
jgi:transcriptional regulator GlxA family with amidase domain